MLLTSQDVLFMTIAACVGLLTIFFCWGLFYLISAIRNVYGVTKDLKNIFKKAEEIIDALKSKIHESATYLVLFGEVMKKAMDAVHAFSERHREKKEAERCEKECCSEEPVSDVKKTKAKKIRVK